MTCKSSKLTFYIYDDMIEKLKKNLKSNGQTLKWFYDNNIKESTGLTYPGFMAQLNGYTKRLSETVLIEIETFLGK